MTVLVGLAAAGCGDLVTQPGREPASRPEPDVRQALFGDPKPRRAEVAFLCYVSERRTDGFHRYRYGRMALRFPEWARSQAGATAVFRYRVVNSDGSPIGAANCRIPATQAALAHTRRRFRVADPAGPDDAMLQLAGCVTTTCVLDPIEVTAPPAGSAGGGQDDACDWWVCDDSSFGDDYAPGGGWSDGDGGEEWDPGTPPQPCETGSPVLDSPAVQNLFASLWAKSNYDPAIPMADRRERAGWIIRDAEGNYFGQELQGGWLYDACEFSSQGPVAVPQGAVALVHTHPYKNGDILQSCEAVDLSPLGVQVQTAVTYRNEPSRLDDAMMRQLRALHPGAGLVGIVLDADRITAYTGAAGDGDLVPLDRCGY